MFIKGNQLTRKTSLTSASERKDEEYIEWSNLFTNMIYYFL